MNIWGPTASGKMGVMTEDDVVEFAKSNIGVGGKIWEKNVRKAASAIMNHHGQGGGTNYYHHGKRIFHVSEGKRKGPVGDKISIFFTCLGNVNASIIGLGHHVDSASYDLDWKTASWQAPPNPLVL